MQEPLVVAPCARPRAETAGSKTMSPLRRAAAAALAVAVLAGGAGARQRRTMTPGDTEASRAERAAANRATYPGSHATFWPLIVWVRNEVRKLDKRADRLAQSVSRPAPDLREARKQAAKVSKHSRTASRWLQGNRPSRPHLEPRPGPPRDLGATLGDIANLECLVDEVAAAVLSPHSSRQLDVVRHTATLETLERIEALARQVEADLRAR